MENENNANRMSKTEYYLAIALAVSKRSTCLKRRYGAVIVNNDEIISTGYNEIQEERKTVVIGETVKE